MERDPCALPTAAAPPTRFLQWLCSDQEIGAPIPRGLIVVAHPDDETVGAGSRLSQLRGSQFIVATDGAPRDLLDAHANGFSTAAEYALARRQEMTAACALADIPAASVEWLGFPDKELHYSLADLTTILVARIRADPPMFIMTHAYEGGHPDHDSVCLTVHASLALAGGSVPILELTSYHRGPKGPRFGVFLPNSTRPARRHRLSPLERALKRNLLDCYKTQSRFLSNVSLDEERFRLAPSYGFTRPPHRGAPLYEDFGWQVSIGEWLDAAHWLKQQLCLEGPL
jgi:LmbE family N-acetylglucosaminyl deacetylase